MITVLSVPDCPNATRLIERLRQAMPASAGPPDVVIVRDESEASAWGMCGSPTLLVDGVDPFASAGTEPSVSCRLYFEPDGRPAGAPSVDQLREVTRSRSGRADGSTSWLDTVGRDGRGRLAPPEGGMRAVQQAVLRSVVSTGAMPDERALDMVSGGGANGHEVLAVLADQDFLSVDDSGVHAAYPFSLRPTRHQVAIEDGPTVWAMCAIDALGIAPMLGRPTTIASSDPITQQPITLRVTPTAAEWQPTDAVVFAGRRRGSGSAASICCDAINFFASAHTAVRWAALHPEIGGAVLDRAEAAAIGRAIFGGLMASE
ncbi:MAG: organomercurial lyase [Sporichthyaceae bacterium]